MFFVSIVKTICLFCTACQKTIWSVSYAASRRRHQKSSERKSAFTIRSFARWRYIAGYNGLLLVALLKKVVYDPPDSKLGGVRIELTFENFMTTDDVYKVLRPDKHNFIWRFMELFQFTPILVMASIISRQPIRTKSRSQTYVIEVATRVRNYNSNQILSSDTRNRPESNQFQSTYLDSARLHSFQLNSI